MHKGRGDLMKRMSISKILEERAQAIDKAIERYVPRRYSKKSLVFTLNWPRYEYSPKAVNKAIANPIWEFLDRGGKRWRPVLFLLICEALGKNAEDLLDFAIIPEVVHNGTLIIDDIEDSSEFRRGKPSTHKLFGLDIAINVGNAMYYLPLLSSMRNKDKIPADKRSEIYEIYIQEMINLSFGQATDIAWHKGLEKANEKQYLQMCINKTGALARMSAKIAAVLSDASDDFVEKIGKFAESVGVAFQIQDDILDLVGEEFAELKGGIGQDITEGKRTLMVIHTLERAQPQDRKRLLEILKMHTTDQKLKDKAISIIKSYGSIEYSRMYARKIVKESWKEISVLLPRTKAKMELKAFADYLIERKF
jgi:geranylgeranyl pyrophosphate synthase